MRKILLIILLTIGFAKIRAQFPHHVIHASIHQVMREISVTDTVVFPAGIPEHDRNFEFTLPIGRINPFLKLRLSIESSLTLISHHVFGRFAYLCFTILRNRRPVRSED